MGLRINLHQVKPSLAARVPLSYNAAFASPVFIWLIVRKTVGDFLLGVNFIFKHYFRQKKNGNQF